MNSSEVCRQLHKRKCQVEKQLCQEVTKRRKIEESVHSLKEEVKVLKKAQRSGKPVSLQLLNSSSGNETLDLNSMTFSKYSTDSKLSDASDTVNFALFVKDKFCLSDEGYYEISLLFRELLLDTTYCEKTNKISQFTSKRDSNNGRGGC